MNVVVIDAHYLKPQDPFLYWEMGLYLFLACFRFNGI